MATDNRSPTETNVRTRGRRRARPEARKQEQQFFFVTEVFKDAIKRAAAQDDRNPSQWCRWQIGQLLEEMGMLRPEDWRELSE